MRLTDGLGKVNDLAVVSEDVHLLDAGNGLCIELFQCQLDFLVITSNGLVGLLDLAPRSALASNAYGCLQLGEFLSIHLWKRTKGCTGGPFLTVTGCFLPDIN